MSDSSQTTTDLSGLNDRQREAVISRPLITTQYYDYQHYMCIITLIFGFNIASF